MDPETRDTIDGLLRRQPRGAVHEGQSRPAPVRLLGQDGRGARHGAARLRGHRRAPEPGDPGGHQGLRQLADDPPAVRGRRTDRRQRHRHRDVRLRRTRQRARHGRAHGQARRASTIEPAAADIMVNAAPEPPGRRHSPEDRCRLRALPVAGPAPPGQPRHGERPRHSADRPVECGAGRRPADPRAGEPAGPGLQLRQPQRTAARASR